METRAEFCKKESARYAARAKRAQNKIERTESMVLYYLGSHDLKKVESHEFTLKRNKTPRTVWLSLSLTASLMTYAASRRR
jgi:hypothetical protein